jgi:hypothetical protein
MSKCLFLNVAVIAGALSWLPDCDAIPDGTKRRMIVPDSLVLVLGVEFKQNSHKNGSNGIQCDYGSTEGAVEPRMCKTMSENRFYLQMSAITSSLCAIHGRVQSEIEM